MASASEADLFSEEKNALAAAEENGPDGDGEDSASCAQEVEACGDEIDEIDQNDENANSDPRKRKKLGIAYPAEGLCPYCKTQITITRSNWARHLQRKHPEVISEHEEALSTQRTEQQSKLPFKVVALPNKAARCLALYAATTTMPLYHVENKYFKELLRKVPNLKLPDRRALARQIDDELQKLQLGISSYLAGSAYYYSFGVDISTTKGMVHSFLGVTAHVFAKNNKCVRTFALDMVRLEERHTGAYVLKVFQECLASHKLSMQRILRIVTDSGSSMLSAFYEPYKVPNEVADDADSEFFFVERDDAAMEQHELLDDDAEDAENTFTHVHNGHIRCVIHRIESALRATFNSNDSMKKLRAKVLQRISPFARSHILTTALYEHSRSVCGKGLKLLFPATTRWSSIAIVFGRVKQLRPAMGKVCYDNNVEDLSSEEYRSVDLYLQVLEPIRRFEVKLQQESVPTISLVYSGICGILDMLEGLKAQRGLSQLCTTLQSELRHRFTDVLNSGEDGSDPVYIVGACLDPVVAQTTNIFDEKLDLCRKAIKEMAKLLIDDYDGSAPPVVEEVPISAGSDVFGFEIPKKKKRIVPHAEEDKVETEIDEYRFLLQSAIKGGAAEFWIQYDAKLAYLAKIARNVLAVPAASSSVERLFSQMTLSSTGHKGRSGSQAIRRKSLLSFNEQYINL
ncbi:hypothetical protein AAVH_30499 [Aphelenchoides avenae]|nr:hypothetical protein AAVH_30499 [Aphelenchus avenae]